MKFDTVLVCGDREWDGQKIVDDVVFLLKRRYGVHTLIEGEARGADKQGRLAGEKYGLKIKPFKAEWHKYGKAAGPIRNREQFSKGKPDIVVAFHDDLLESNGTLDMVNHAASSDEEVIIVIVSHDEVDENRYIWRWFSPPVEGFSLTQ